MRIVNRPICRLRVRDNANRVVVGIGIILAQGIWAEHVERVAGINTIFVVYGHRRTINDVEGDTSSRA